MSNASNSWQKLFMTVFLSFLVIFGFWGNVIVWITFRICKITNGSVSALIVNLSVADTLQCINFIFVITAINDIVSYETDTWCQLNGFGNVTFAVASFLSLTLISINKYFVIVKHSNEIIFTWRNTLLFIFFVWFYSFVLAVAPLAGLSEYTFIPTAYFCWSDVLIGQGLISYSVVAVVTSVIIPFTVLCFCTWKILVTLKRSRQRVEENISSISARNEEERRITFILLIIIITFVIFNVPACTAVTLRTLNYEIQPWIQLLLLAVVLMNHAINPVIYGLMNKNFRKAISGAFSRSKVRNTLEATPRRTDET